VSFDVSCSLKGDDRPVDATTAGITYKKADGTASSKLFPMRTIDVILPNEPPEADANGPYWMDEGSGITLDGTGTTDPDGDPLVYYWDLDDDGLYDDATTSTPYIDWTTLAGLGLDDDGTYDISVYAYDGIEGDSSSSTITIENVAPVANAGDDKTGDETVTFTFTGSHTDPGTADTHTYEWDFDYDGMTFDVDATGNGVTNTWDDDFEGNVALRVTDDDGASSIDTTYVDVNNVAPTVTADFDVTVYAGDVVPFLGTYTDPGNDEHTFEWVFGNSLTDDTTLTPTTIYPNKGTYVVTLTVTDDDGGIGYDTAIVEVLPIPITIDVKPGSWPNSINLNPNGVISVAVLTTYDFDALTVDPDTIIWAGAAPLRWAVEDVDGDGDLDMVFKFKRGETDLTETSTMSTMTGKNLDGYDIEGQDAVRIVPPKK
jgi:hypothetical protein